jgi:hypothetical protein
VSARPLLGRASVLECAQPSGAFSRGRGDLWLREICARTKAAEGRRSPGRSAFAGPRLGRASVLGSALAPSVPYPSPAPTPLTSDQPGSLSESQRDSARCPGHNPLWGWGNDPRRSLVGAGRQPRALGHNPFWIGCTVEYHFCKLHVSCQAIWRFGWKAVCATHAVVTKRMQREQAFQWCCTPF